MQNSTLGWSLGVIFRGWHDGVTAALADFPHGARGHQILEFVAGGTLPSQVTLATHLGIDRTVLTYVIDDLVEAGVIERRADAADRRVRRLAITEDGRTTLDALDARVAAAEEALLQDLSPEDQGLLRAVLDRAGAAVHHGQPGHDACSVVVDLIEPKAAQRVAS